MLIKVQSIVLICISVVYTILAHISHKKDAWNGTIKKYNTALNNNATFYEDRQTEINDPMMLDLLKLDVAQTEYNNFKAIMNKFNTGGEVDANNNASTDLKKRLSELNKNVIDLIAEIVKAYGTDKLKEYAKKNQKDNNMQTIINNAIAKAKQEKRTFNEDKTTKETALTEAKKSLEAAKTAAATAALNTEISAEDKQAAKDAVTAAAEQVKTKETDLNTFLGKQNTSDAIYNELDNHKPDGIQMQERSIVLVIISVLVLLLDMNGLLFSGEVGDPLQVVVGAMLIVFGINVLVNFDKNNKINLGTIKVLRDLDSNADKKTETQVAAVFGTIGGVLCAVLGTQILVKSVVKKRPSFKSLRRKKK